jgi:hypothetical protein
MNSDALQRHVRQVAAMLDAKPDQKWKTSWQFVAEHGQPYRYRRLPTWCPRMTPRQCFGNCWELVETEEDLIYVEGFASSAEIPLPIHHAWIVRGDDNRVIDPTCRRFREYYGVPFIRDYILSTTSGLSVLDNWQERWPLLRMADPSAVIYNSQPSTHRANSTTSPTTTTTNPSRK